MTTWHNGWNSDKVRNIGLFLVPLHEIQACDSLERFLLIMNTISYIDRT